MRYVPLADWQPVAYHTYFAHMCSEPDARSVSLVLVREGSGRKPCRGVDRDTEDDYAGDVLLHPENEHGKQEPVFGAFVQYTRESDIDDVVAEVLTDKNGHHEVWLEPGAY